MCYSYWCSDPKTSQVSVKVKYLDFTGVSKGQIFNEHLLILGSSTFHTSDKFPQVPPSSQNYNQ